jgi:hypothetical protein
VVVSILLLAGLSGGLIGYKARGGLKRMNELRATGSLRRHTEASHRPAGSEIAATGAQTLAYLNIVGQRCCLVCSSALLYMRQSLPDSWQPCSGKDSSNRDLPQQLRALP